ncbi:MAG: hypothetical protein KKB31_02530 [Nanoarchaeota archaeon]|nr:hypothetical protein [Nanoarchaeota archaeon]
MTLHTEVISDSIKFSLEQSCLSRVSDILGKHRYHTLAQESLDVYTMQPPGGVHANVEIDLASGELVFRYTHIKGAMNTRLIREAVATEIERRGTRR